MFDIMGHKEAIINVCALVHYLANKCTSTAYRQLGTPILYVMVPHEEAVTRAVALVCHLPNAQMHIALHTAEVTWPIFSPLWSGLCASPVFREHTLQSRLFCLQGQKAGVDAFAVIPAGSKQVVSGAITDVPRSCRPMAKYSSLGSQLFPYAQCRMHRYIATGE